MLCVYVNSCWIAKTKTKTYVFRSKRHLGPSAKSDPRLRGSRWFASDIVHPLQNGAGSRYFAEAGNNRSKQPYQIFFQITKIYSTQFFFFILLSILCSPIICVCLRITTNHPTYQSTKWSTNCTHFCKLFVLIVHPSPSCPPIHLQYSNNNEPPNYQTNKKKTQTKNKQNPTISCNSRERWVERPIANSC